MSRLKFTPEMFLSYLPHELDSEDRHAAAIIAQDIFDKWAKDSAPSEVTNNFEWEYVSGHGGGTQYEHLYRTRGPGGWLFRMSTRNSNPYSPSVAEALAFVPLPPLPEAGL